jgi:hypothetical protein
MNEKQYEKYCYYESSKNVSVHICPKKHTNNRNNPNKSNNPNKHQKYTWLIKCGDNYIKYGEFDSHQASLIFKEHKQPINCIGVLFALYMDSNPIVTDVSILPRQFLLAAKKNNKNVTNGQLKEFMKIVLSSKENTSNKKNLIKPGYKIQIRNIFKKIE